MRAPNLRALLREYRGLFRVDGAVIDIFYSDLSAEKASGITMGHQHTRGRRATIVIDHNLRNDYVVPVLLHELLHVEQFVNEEDMDHGAAFQWRIGELLAAGLAVADHRGSLRHPR